MLLYFASPDYDQDQLAAAMSASYDDCQSIGSSSSAEIVTGKMLDKSLVVIAFDRQAIAEVDIQIIPNISQGIRLAPAMAGFEAAFGQKLIDMDAHSFVGIVLIDGLRRLEESLLDSLRNSTKLNFISGSASDDVKSGKTFVHANGKVYTDAAILALVRPEARFDLDVEKLQ